MNKTLHKIVSEAETDLSEKTLGNAGRLLRRGDLKRARKLLLAYLEQDSLPLRERLLALSMCADCLRRLGNHRAAYQQYCKYTLTKGNTMPDVPVFHIYACLSRLTTDDDSPVMQQHLAAYLTDRSSDADRVESLVTGLISRRYVDTHFSLRRASQDPLLLTALRHSQLADAGVELFISKLRRALLTKTMVQQPDETLTALAGALAQRCHNTEFITWSTPIEQAMTDALVHTLEYYLQDENWSLDQIYPSLLLVAMYIPLRDLPYAKRLAALSNDLWPEPLRALARESLTAAREERELIGKIRMLDAPPDREALYAGHAYPRWLRLPKVGPATSYLARYPQLRVALPGDAEEGNAHAPGAIDAALTGATATARPFRMLIVGCASGQPALAAAQQFHKVDVTAVDTALHNLTYARRKADQYHLDNIHFALGPIESVPNLDTTFHVVSCANLLEQLPHPEDGLESLLKVLESGGVLRLQLPSRIASEPVEQFRLQHVSKGCDASTEGIRNLRHNLLSSCASLNEWPELYSMSSCRNLLFGEQRTFTLEEVKHLLSQFNLKFAGFNFQDPGVVENYQGAFPNDPMLLDLDNWHAFELDNPTSFMDRYDFHCQPAA